MRNVIADGLSRSKPLSSEWALDHQSFTWLCQREFVPSVDLFATRENHKLPSYVSPVPDDKAVAIDAFSISWSKGKRIYLFPPPSMMPKVLPLVENYKGAAIIVTPDWEARPWYVALSERAKEHFLLPSPQLSQKVGEKRFDYLPCWDFPDGE